jgi:L-fuculose-phosphate aldolase
MNELGVNRGTSGNVSVRAGGGFLVTPSAFPYERMRPSDVVEMGLDGSVKGRGTPSTEWRFHASVYAARPEAQAIVHAHPIHATALSCLRRALPPFHYMVAVAGGTTVTCARYATFGTQELADAAVEALVGRRACLLANHGLLAFGGSLEKALALAVEVEALCEQYLAALAVGEPTLLSEEEMRDVLARFRTYGQDVPAAPRRGRRQRRAR